MLISSLKHSKFIEESKAFYDSVLLDIAKVSNRNKLSGFRW